MLALLTPATCDCALGTCDPPTTTTTHKVIQSDSLGARAA